MTQRWDDYGGDLEQIEAYEDAQRRGAEEELDRLAAQYTPPRSSKRDVRNPILALPSARRLMALAPEVRAEVAALMADLAADANTRAQQSWAKSKGPMAAYWKAVSVYAKHIRKVLR